MTIKNNLFIGCITLCLFSCSETTETVEKEELEAPIETVEESNSAANEERVEERPAVEVISFDDKSTFSITTKEAGVNPNTGTNNVDIYLKNKLFPKPIKLSQDLSMNKLEAGKNGIPKNAVFAYSTWFAGGGEVYYGVVKNGVLQINRKFEDEGMTEEGKFTLYREIDPNVPTKNPDAYITYDSDNKSSKQLMIAFSEDGKALYAKYYGQARHLQLKFVKDASEGRNIIDYYDEIVGDEVVGTYKLTHSGNWDYVEYSPKNNDKKFKFTINHDVTIDGDTYRTTPSL